MPQQKDEDAMDAEEAEAWAAMRLAFGEDAAPAAPRMSSTAAGGARKRTEEAVPERKAAKVAPAKAAARPVPVDAKAPPQAGGDSTDPQGQVDRLVGEVQRLAQEPFPVGLITALWSLRLEDQLDVLLGASGTP